MKKLSSLQSKSSKKNKRLTILGILLAIILAVIGAVAYLTDTETIINKMSIDTNFDIDIIEPQYDAKLAENPEYGQNLKPKQSIIKDPTIVNRGTVPAYVAVEVRLPLYDGYTYDEDAGLVYATSDLPLFGYNINEDWDMVSEDLQPINKYMYLDYVYNKVLQPGEEVNLFNEIIVMNLVNPTIINASDLTITVKAIQTQGSNDAYGAYELFKKQFSKTMIEHERLNEYTLPELKTIANDLAVNGEDSVYYKKFNYFMNYGGEKIIPLSGEANGQLAKIRIVGINRDVSSDGSKNGLTFMFTNALPFGYRMNANIAGNLNWKDSELRNSMNNSSGSLYTQMTALTPYIKDTKVSSVGSDGATQTTSNDKFFIIGSRELWGDLFYQINPKCNIENKQYDLFRLWNVYPHYGINEILRGMNKTAYGLNFTIKTGTGYSDGSELNQWWTRTGVLVDGVNAFVGVDDLGDPIAIRPGTAAGVIPLFCM